jgi:acetate kinase
VHGGDVFTDSVALDDKVLAEIESLNDLAPLHNPVAVSGIHAARKIFGTAMRMAAVFDTAFHATLPATAATYAIDDDLAKKHRIRRYGFHGMAHHYSLLRYAELSARPEREVNIVTLHLGNGSSACAIRAGRSIDTSMGFTPLEGLVMGTRSGDLDPAILDFIAAKEGLSLPEMEGVLNKQSGLLGISGLTNDMRELLAEAGEHDDRRARLAIEIFAYRVRKYIGAYLAAMNGADAILFAGGIGENAAAVRTLICDGLEWLGVKLDDARNKATVGGGEGKISADGSRVEVWVVPTDEELLIARDTVRVVQGLESRY